MKNKLQKKRKDRLRRMWSVPTITVLSVDQTKSGLTGLPDASYGADPATS